MGKQGKRDALVEDFQKLVDGYGPEIFRYLYRVFGGCMDAEDCLQETILRAFCAFPQTRPGSNYRAWLYAIATNTARTMMRQGQRRKQRELGSTNQESGIPDSVLEAVNHSLQLARIQEAVAKLPQKQRLALILRKYHEFSYEEIGEVLSSSAESARANVYQALRRLRSEFSREEAGEHGRS